MPFMTLSQLRNTRQLMEWLKAGETIELRYRKRVIGRIIPDESIITHPRDAAQCPETKP
jgi:hypothetical protein